MTACKYYQAGNCKYGIRCRNSHLTIGLESQKLWNENSRGDKDLTRSGHQHIHPIWQEARKWRVLSELDNLSSKFRFKVPSPTTNWSPWESSDSELDPEDDLHQPGRGKFNRLESATLTILLCSTCNFQFLVGDEDDEHFCEKCGGSVVTFNRDEHTSDTEHQSHDDENDNCLGVIDESKITDQTSVFEDSYLQESRFSVAETKLDHICAEQDNDTQLDAGNAQVPAKVDGRIRLEKGRMKKKVRNKKKKSTVVESTQIREVENDRDTFIPADNTKFDSVDVMSGPVKSRMILSGDAASRRIRTKKRNRISPKCQKTKSKILQIKFKRSIAVLVERQAILFQSFDPAYISFVLFFAIFAILALVLDI